MKKLMKAKVLAPESPNKSTALFGGEASGILNWNNVPYPHFFEFREEIRELFWSAKEINMAPDIKQFPTLSEREQDAFLTIIGGMLSSLDAPQTDMGKHISDYATDPSVKAVMATIADQESEHNVSYSYVLSSLVSLSEQNAAFEVGREHPEILERNERIGEIYNRFTEEPTIENLLMVIVQSGILEGLFFYSAFAFFYNLARESKMMATSTMISYINRDEVQHGKFMGELFRAVLNENPEYNNETFINGVYDEFQLAVEKETKWAHYILRDIDGIDMEEMEGYIKYRANKMLRIYGLSDIYEGFEDNPMKWIRAYEDNFDDTKTDFFEQKNRQYTKVSTDNGFDELLNGVELEGFDEL